MEYIQGDKENSKGKVLMYSKFVNLNDPIFEKLFSVYMTDDIFDFQQRSDCSQEGVDEIIQINRNLAKSDGVPDESSQFILKPMYQLIIDLHSEGELKNFKDDIIFVGRYSSILVCAEKIHVVARDYGFNFMKQKFKKEGGLWTPVEESKKDHGDLENLISYEDVEPLKIKDYILNNFVVPMIDSVNLENDMRFKDILNKFMKFSASPYLITDVSRLCDVISKGNVNDNLRLIELYLSKIDAIHNERFEEAGLLKRKIENMLF